MYELTQRAENKSGNLNHPLTAISIFSGGGGLDLGFAAAGFYIACSTDIDPFSCETLMLNSGKKRFYRHNHIVRTDIKELSAADLIEKAKLNVGSIRVIFGGPPCQAFSVFGQRKGTDDPRGNLVWEYLRIVEEVEPDVFLFENVAGFESIHGGKLYRDFLKRLTIHGQYTISSQKYEMADYGVPQFRSRIFIIGNRFGVKVPEMQRTHSSNKGRFLAYRVARDALKEMPAPDQSHSISNHKGRVHSDQIKERYRNLEFGERDPKTRVNKLHPDRPSFTIIVGSDKGGGKGHIHPFDPRELTPRESARIQTFPDWWEFGGTGRHVIRQVGNAVPPLFAAQLAEHIKVHVFNAKRRRSYDTFTKRLELHYLTS